MKTKGIKLIVYFVLGFMLILLIALFYEAEEQEKIESPDYGVGELNPEVLMYQDYVEAELSKYGLEDLTNIILAIIQVESGGRVRDVMQSSESIGLPPNSIQDPLVSIQVGIKHFHNVYLKAQEQSVDVDSVIQSYNFGGGYIDYVSSNGKEHTEDIAFNFSMMQVAKNPSYNCGGDTNNFRYPACYGNYLYTTKVKSYLTDNSNEGVALDKEAYEIIMNEALKYEGYPYAWGGASPSTSFDCSGLIMWVYAKAGISLPRTSYEQYKATTPISKDELKKGDLIFFKTANYNPVTHIGIYVGNNRMYDANNSGIGYSDLNDYWTTKIVGYGRVQ
ncbi:peptidase P60 [Bacilli bacterium]|nr:hypothetical protein WH51_11515 [Bacilli bacterium VT-13-104]PZD83158.1 peptidase P60 [Bacilli bacterium]PZD84301.1 peptidase P60 [Bacilli bacterium]PZD86309.1 peptidase P60 [Bacilli bacterium]RCO04313.1 peptidase P60 [Bacilli bacterium]